MAWGKINITGVPVILAYDSFNRANGSLGTAEIGGAWTVAEGTFSVSSNQAKGSTSAASRCFAVLPISTPNCSISCEVTWFTDEITSIVARSTSANAENQMRCRINGSTVSIEKRISDSATTLVSVSYSWTSGLAKLVKFVCNGNDFSVFINGVLIASATDDNALKTNTYVGMLAAKSGAVPATLFNNFSVSL